MLGNLTRKTRRSRLMLPAIIAISAVAVGLFAREAVSIYPVKSADRLQGVSSLEMAQLGMTFHKLDPLYYSPGTTRADVEKMARAAGFSGGASIQESILTRVVTSNQTPQIDRPAWVVSFNPAQIQLQRGGTAKLALALYDAETGEFIMASIVGSSPAAGFPSGPPPID